MWTEQEESTTVWDAHSDHAAQVRAHRPKCTPYYQGVCQSHIWTVIITCS
jgi:hypothetical protein